MPVAVCSGDRGRREEMAELGFHHLLISVLSSPSLQNITSPPELRVRGFCFCTQLIVLEKGLGCSGCTPRS